MSYNNGEESVNNDKLSLGNYIAIFLFLGVFLCVAYYIVTSDLEFKQNADKITAIIERNNISSFHPSGSQQRVYVSYTYKGVEYNMIPLDKGSSAMKEGDRITVYCNRDDPTDVRYIESSIGSTSKIFFVLVAIVIILTIWMIILGIRNKILKKE